MFALLTEKLKRRPSTKSLAAIGQALRTGKVDGDVELCPHCGEVLRVRSRLSDEAINIVNEWLASKREATP